MFFAFKKEFYSIKKQRGSTLFSNDMNSIHCNVGATNKKKKKVMQLAFVICFSFLKT